MNARMIGAMSVALLLCALVPLAFSDDGSDAATVTAPYGYFSVKCTVTSDDPASVEYIVVDYGDGTVLDGRWEYYAKLQEQGTTLTSEQAAGVSAYQALLEQHGGNLWVTNHRYDSAGSYTVTAVAINPLGYVHDGGMPYDGVLSTDETGFNGGLGSETAGDVTVPTDADLESTSFKALNGSWDRIAYTYVVQGWPTITFDTHGGNAIQSVEVVDGAYTMPSDPVRSGYTFAGWFTDSAYAEPFADGTSVTSPITLHAKWSEASAETYTRTIVFDANGGTGEMKEITLTNDIPIMSYELPECAFTYDGHTFKGWKFYNQNKSPGDKISLGTGTYTVIAQWKETTTPTYTHTVSYDANGGTGTMANTVVTDNDNGSSVVVLAECDFTYTGYEFTGWKIGTTVYQPGDAVPVAGNASVTAKAQWNQTFVLIDVYLDNVKYPFYAGEKVSDVPTDKAVRPSADKIFAGWSDSPTSGSTLEGSVALTNNMRLYSVWRDASTPTYTHTVSYDANGGTGTTASTVVTNSVSGDSQVTLAENKFTAPAGKQFAGWKVGSTVYQPGQSVKVAGNANVQAVAQWTEHVDDGDDEDKEFPLIALILIIVGSFVALVGIRYHPLILILGAAIAVVGVLCFFGIVDWF